MRRQRFICFIQLVYIHLFLFACLLKAEPTHATNSAHQDYYIRNFTDEDGLLQNSVESIVKDELGYIWMSTQNGLAKFDGNKFRIYLKKDLGTTTDRVMEVLIYPYLEGVFALYADGELIHIIKGIPRLVSKKESLYQQYNNLFKDFGFKNVFWKKGYLGGEDGKSRNIFRFDSSKYVVVENNIFNFYKNQKFQYAVDFSIPSNTLLNIDNIRIIDSNIYYAENGKIFSVDSKGVHPVQIFLDGKLVSNGNGLKFKIHSAFEDKISKYITDGNHLYSIDENNKRTISAKMVIKDFPFYEYNITSVFYDDQMKHFYFGSLSRGVFQLVPKKFQVLKNDGKSSNIFYGHLEYKKGQILAGSGEVFALPGNVQTKQTIKSSSDGWFYLKDNQGRVWTKDNHIVNVLDSSHLQILKSYKFSGGISAIGYDQHEDEIYIYETNIDKLMKVRASDFLSEEFQVIADFKPYAVGFYKIDTGRILIAANKGLYVYHPKEKKLELWKGTEDMYVRHVFKQYPDDRFIWITVEGKGIYRLDESTLTRLPLDNNEYLLFAHAIVDDVLGNFWISSNKGLFRVKKSDLENYSPQRPVVFYKYFNKNNGFNSNEFNGGSSSTGQKLSNGMLSFASMDGIVIFDPRKIKDDLPDGQITINRILNGEKSLKIQDTIIWDNRKEYLKIELSTPYFGAPEDIKFIYKIDGNPPMVSSDGWIQFNALSVGKHILEVYVPLGNDENKRILSTLIIDVPPKWFESWWFYLIVLVLFFGTIYFVYKIRVKWLESENVRLEVAVKERTLELEQAVQVLMESESKLNRELYFQQSINSNVSHNIKTPLRYLMSSIGRFHQVLQKQDSEYNKNESGKIFEASQELYNSTVQFVSYMKAANKLGNPQIEKVIIRDLAQDVVTFFRKFIGADSIRIINLIDRRYTVETPPDFLKLIISNFLDNSIKHAQADKIELEAKVFDNELYLFVRDNGVGIPPEYMKMLNSYFQQKCSTMIGDVYVDIGIGYFTIKEMLPFVGAKIEFTENLEVGSEIKIIFKKYEVSNEE